MSRLGSFALLMVVAGLLAVACSSDSDNSGGDASTSETSATDTTTIGPSVTATTDTSVARMDPVEVDRAVARVSGAASGERDVHIYIDDAFLASTTADPEFSYTVPALRGTHEVCTFEITPEGEENPGLGCDSFEVVPLDGPWVAYSADFHVSTPGGRWQENDERVEDFVAELNDYETQPEMLIVVGDMVDNVAMAENGELVPGDLDRWQADVDRYSEIVGGLGDIPTVHTLGPGHDANVNVSTDTAQEVFGPENDYRDWQGTRLIWMGSKPDSEDLTWLDDLIEGAPGSVVLAVHVPVQTDVTAQLDPDRTQPPGDPIYDVLERHADKIETIISGHIHWTSASELFGIPVHLCPLIHRGTYCRLVATADGVAVERAELTAWQ